MSRRLLAGLIVGSAALDVASYLMLGSRGAAELNPVTLVLGPVAILAKLALAAAIVFAVKRQVPYFQVVGAVAACWWGFGAIVNSW